MPMGHTWNFLDTYSCMKAVLDIVKILGSENLILSSFLRLPRSVIEGTHWNQGFFMNPNSLIMNPNSLLKQSVSNEQLSIHLGQFRNDISSSLQSKLLTTSEWNVSDWIWISIAIGIYFNIWSRRACYLLTGVWPTQFTAPEPDVTSALELTQFKYTTPFKRSYTSWFILVRVSYTNPGISDANLRYRASWISKQLISFN